MKRTLLFILVLSCFRAHADPRILLLGALRQLTCQDQLRAIARDEIRGRHTDRVQLATMAFQENWVEALVKAGSDPKHAETSDILLHRLYAAADYPNLLGSTAEGLFRRIDSRQLAFVFMPYLANDGKPLDRSVGFFHQLVPNDLLFHSEGEAKDSFKEMTAEEIATLHEIRKAQGPMALVFTRAPMPKTEDPGAGNDALQHLTSVVHLVRNVLDVELLEAWANENARCILAGGAPDLVFFKYGKMVGRKPSVEGTFALTFLDCRGTYAAARSLPVMVPGVGDGMLTTVSFRMFRRLKNSGPAGQQIIDLDDVTDENILKRAIEWGDTMEQTLSMP